MRVQVDWAGLAGPNDENREEHLAWTEAAIINGEGVVVQ